MSSVGQLQAETIVCPVLVSLLIVNWDRYRAEQIDQQSTLQMSQEEKGN